MIADSAMDGQYDLYPCVVLEAYRYTLKGDTWVCYGDIATFVVEYYYFCF